MKDRFKVFNLIVLTILSLLINRSYLLKYKLDLYVYKEN